MDYLIGAELLEEELSFYLDERVSKAILRYSKLMTLRNKIKEKMDEYDSGSQFTYSSLKKKLKMIEKEIETLKNKI